MKAVKALIEAGKVEEAIVLLEQMKDARPEDDAVRYELGNAYWKKQDWKRCLDNYTEAIALNPQSPAVEMKKMVMDIIGFYNKEMYNV
ncbi:MAG: tetratricopeptide repeat protein [Bacteroidaceae bacterium]|nr:tetratricopeptide repeat protein [Bacteroidaceae bacterium]